MDEHSQIFEWLGNNYPIVLVIIAVLAAFNWFVLPFYKSFLSAKENSVKAMKDKLNECDKKINELTQHINNLEAAHKKELELQREKYDSLIHLKDQELEIERQKAGLLMSFKDQAIGVFSVISKQFEIPLPKIILDEIRSTSDG